MNPQRTWPGAVRRGMLVLMGGGALAACARGPGAPVTAPPPEGGGAGGPRASDPVNSGLAIDAAGLSRLVTAAGVRVVDARPAAEYEKGHVPGAISLPVAETFDPTRDKNYPDTKERLESLFAAKGVGSGDRVVVYDNGAETTAARLFWTLEYLGHARAAVLDGGLKAWQASGGAISTEAAAPAPVAFTAAVQPGRLHAKADCERMLGASAVVMLDSRSPEEWRGDDVRAKFGGRIPGAVNVDWREHFAPDGLLKSPAALRQLYLAKAVTPDKEVVAYCQTGQRSSVAYWVLRLLGYPKVANYAGSWVEWGNDPATPKAQGA